MNPTIRDQQNLLAVNVSLAANLLLAVSKVVVGITGGSRALLADGINSASDVVYLLIVRAFMLIARKPPDKEHPFGHRQLEDIAAVIVGAFIMVTGVFVFFGAVEQIWRLWCGDAEMPIVSVLSIWVAGTTIAMKIALVVYTVRVAKQTGSIALSAMARDHRNDICSISVAMIGILASRMGFAWVDPAAAALVAAFIFHTGLSVVLESSHELMNLCPGEEIVNRLRKVVGSVRGVDEVEDVLIHRIGYYLLIDVTIGINGRLSVVEGDRIATRVEHAVCESEKYVRRVSVHYHPSGDAEGQ